MGMKLMILSYTMHTHLVGIAPFSVMGVSVTFPCWFAVALCKSVLHTFDLFSDSNFAGQFLNSRFVHRNEQVAHIWTFAFSRSNLRMPLSLQQVVLIVWTASLAQLVWPLVALVRKEECHRKGAALNTEGDAGLGQRIITNDTLDNGQVATSLAEAAGLCTVSSLMVKRAKARIAIHQDQLQFGIQASHSIVINCIENLSEQLRNRLILVLVLENCAQLYLQTGVLAIQRFLTNTDANVNHVLTWSDMRPIGSILSSLMQLLLHLSTAFEFFRLLYDVRCMLSPWGRLHRPGTGKVLMNSFLVGVACLLACFSILLTAVRSACIFLCEHSVWNASDIMHASHGCLDLSSFAASS